MKQINKSHLLLISSAILVIASLPFLNFSSSSTLNIWKDILSRVSTWENHVSRLYELILSPEGDGTGVKLNINNSSNQLNISNGIVVWDNASSSRGTLSSIWWWMGNQIWESRSAWIAWWSSNEIGDYSDNSVIWGWMGNHINWENAVIVWWERNGAESFWVVVWWYYNTASGNGVSLWGKNNEAGSNSLVMWSGAKWTRAFARNAPAEDNAARIDAKSWVLIGTTTAVQWVSLVVEGAVKIDWSGDNIENWITWEIRVVNGCFYAYDWKYWHVISQTNDPEACTWFVSTEKCIFWNVYLQQWDQVTWYNATISTSCVGERVVCSGGVLLTVAWNNEGYNSPYCYETTN